MEKVFRANRNQRKAGVAICISEEIDFKKTVTKYREGHYIMITGYTKEDTTLINIYAPSRRVLQNI